MPEFLTPKRVEHTKKQQKGIATGVAATGRFSRLVFGIN